MSVVELPVLCCAPVVGATLSDEEAVELEGLFRAIADRHRLKVLNLLRASEDAVCVCDLTALLGLAQPTVSYHLGKLTRAGLLEREKRGSYAYYRLVDGALDRVAGLLGPVAATTI